MRGLNQEGAEVFRWSAACLRNNSSGEGEAYQRALGAILAFQAQCTSGYSEQETRTLAEESLSILRQLPIGREIIVTLHVINNSVSQSEGGKREIAEEALAIAREIQSGWWLTQSLAHAGSIAIGRGDYAEAKSLFEEALHVSQNNNYQEPFVYNYIQLSGIAMLEGKYAEARLLAQKALVAAEDTGWRPYKSWSYAAIAHSALLQDEYRDAQTHYLIALEMNQELKQRQPSLFALSGLGCAACGLGDYPQARRYFYEALHTAKEMDFLPGLLDTVSGIAGLLADTGQPERAARLAVYVESQVSIRHWTKARNTRLLQALETTLAPERFTSAVEQGKRLDLDETVSTLLVELNQGAEESSLQTVAQSLPDPLTERQLEVLGLIAAGLSNYDIALRLFVGVSTVKTHVNRIYRKLGVKNRTQAVARARELHLL